MVDEVKVTITHFQADDKKAGGAYCTYTGVVKKIEEFSVVSRVMRKFDLALAEIYFRGRVHAPWLPSSGQGAKGQGRRYAARLALDAL